MKLPDSGPQRRCVRLALVHHANQYLITDGYEERHGMGDILGLGSVHWEREFHRRGLLPLLQMHLDYRVPLNLHLSGTLVETLAWHYPQSFALVKRLLRAGLLEMVGSTFSQNVMPFFSEGYNLRQMNEELWLFRRHLGVEPSAVKTFWVPERVWDTEKLARVLRSDQLLNGGYDRVLLDDRILYRGGEHYAGSERERFDRGGLLEADTFRLWEIEGGHGLAVLPISKRLRYAIPPRDCESWQGLHALFGWLADLGDEEVIAVYGDDLERAAGVGGWEPIHPEGYEHLLKWLSGNENVRPVLVGEWAGARATAGVRSVERGTFYELAQLWHAGEDYRGWIEDPQCRGHLQHLARAERALEEAEARGADPGLLELGWKHLLHSSYETSWHNRAEETPGRDFSHLDGGRGMWLAPWAAALTSHARCCHVIARAAEWRALRGGEAHAEVADVDGDGEEELILKNDSLYAVFSPTRGGRLIYLFDLTGRQGRLCVGNVSDDWNLQEEVNRYMDCPRNHPGALADVGHEHDRYEVFVTEARGREASVRLVNVEPSGGMSGAEKRLSLAAGAGHLCVRYQLPPERWRVSTEVCLSPDYYRLLRHGKRGVAEYNGRDWRGWQNGSERVWVRVDARQSTIWDKPYQAESGHGFNLRVTSFSKDFHLELGVGTPSATPCAHRANGNGARRPRTLVRGVEMDTPPAVACEARPPRRAEAGRGWRPPRGGVTPVADFRELVTNPHFMRHFLNRHLPSARGHGLRVQACRIRVLRPHHNKLTLEYNLQISPGRGGEPFTQTLVGTWRQDEHNARMHELLCALWAAGFGEPGGLAVARPVAYWKSLHLRLREKVAGKLLRELLHYPDTDWDAPMRSVAAWLAKLHDSPLRVARRAGRRSETEALRGWLRDMSACDEPWLAHERERVVVLMGELIAAHERRRPPSPCLTHGDFHPENIFLRGRSLTVIDFEQSEMGDPAGDLGYLLAELDVQAVRYWARRGAPSPLDVERLRGVLTEEYVRRRRVAAPEAVPFYMARTYLKHLMHTVRMRGKESPQSVSLWLDKAGEYLGARRSGPRAKPSEEGGMASHRLLTRQAAARDELARRIEEVSRPEFIGRHVYGSLPEYRGRSVTPDACRISVVQNDGTGAATIVYEVEEGPRVFAKLYASDGTGAAHGAHSYEVLRALWDDGCGPASRYRVSEPLAFLPDYNALFIRGAEGRLVADSETDAELAEGSRAAARWLVRMHRSRARVGPVRYPWEVYHKLMHRLAKAAANNPGMVDDMIEMSDRFEELARRLKLHFVQAHGQFRHIHVFVSEECVTVIDLDRSRPSDPAQDLGEYVHRMRTKRYKATRGAGRADEATRTFLEEYAAELPGNLVNLPYYWGYHTLVSLWRYMKSDTPESPDWGRMLDFYKSEFERALSYYERGQ